eukprot:502020-Amphidinium_carterae.1
MWDKQDFVTEKNSKVNPRFKEPVIQVQVDADWGRSEAELRAITEGISMAPHKIDKCLNADAVKLDSPSDLIDPESALEEYEREMGGHRGGEGIQIASKSVSFSDQVCTVAVP